MQKRSFDWGMLIALLLPIIAALPTWGDGVVAGADVEVHIHRIHAITLSLQEGDIYPRWITYLHMGYGYPIFNFYAPLSAYITALLEFAGLHITVAYNIIQTAAWSLGSLGMYYLARRVLPMPAAVLAAALWVFAPSRLYEVWWQGSLAQIVAAAFIPYLLLGVLKNSDKPSLKRIMTIALPYAALITTHTPMMYIATIYAAPLAFFAPMYYSKLNVKQIRDRWIHIGAGFALGIGLSAIFLMPTLLELKYVQISQGLDETVNFLRGQYLTLGEIFTVPSLIDSTDLYLTFPRTLGLAGGILSFIGVIALVWRRKYAVLIAAVAGLVFTVFMMLDVSFDLWLTIPAFANLRFPARLLRIGAVFIALLGGASLLLLPKKWQFTGMVGGIVLVVAQILPISQPYDVFLNWNRITAYDEFLHEQSARTWGTVSYDEFNPIWGERIFLDAPTDAVRYVDEPFHLRVFGRDIAAANWQGFEEESINDNTIRVTTDIDRPVRFRQYYFPGWRATVNGQRAEIYPDEQVGLITIDLPAGEHIVELNYIGTPVQLIATVITWVSVLICFGLRYFGRFQQIEETHDESSLPSVASIALMIAIIGIALLNAFVIQENNWLKIESPPTEPQYMRSSVNNATFGGQIQLLGYTLHDTSISPDEPLDIDLYWHVPDSAMNYRPVVQLITLSQDAAMATSSRLQPAAGEFSTYTPDRFARDPYSLRLFDNADIAPYVGQIMVQLTGTDGNLTLADGSDRLILPEIITVDTEPDAITSTWSEPYELGGIANLLCANIEQSDSSYDITLGWQLNNAPREEFVVMVQGLNAEGELVASGDAPPFDNNYPAWYWRSGQTLYDTQRLPYDEDITQIAIGLYDRATVTRLAVMQGEQSVPNNQILLDLEEQSCQQ